MPRPGDVGICRKPSESNWNGDLTNCSMYAHGVRYSTYRATGMAADELQVGGQSDGRVPAVRHDQDVVIERRTRRFYGDSLRPPFLVQSG